MSIFGEPLPFEDDTATSLIRRVGFPPDCTYAQMPEIYLCPCCTEFSKQQERDRLLREAREAKEAEYRRIMQFDVYDERARPLPSAELRRKIYRRILDEDQEAETTTNVPPPPPTIDDLRRAKKDLSVPKLVVTVHHGRNISAEAEDPISVIVRCGAFEGQTEKVPRGKEMVTPWEELFEFPYMNSAESLEVLVVNEALPESTDKLVGGVVLPCDALHDRNSGDQEPLPVMPVDSMHKGYGTRQDGPLGTILASWYVRDGNDKADGEAVEQQTLSVPLNCTFVAHHVYQYTDHGAEPYPGGVLCVLRDTDDNCSESVLYTPGPQAEPSLSPYYAKEGYYYLSQNPSQLMQLNTEKKLGHILVCVPKEEDGNAEEEELLVIGAVPLEFERLYNKGSAVLLIESKSKDDALWGEISIEWLNKPLDEEEPHPALLEVQKESLFVTIVRGLNLVRRDGDPVAQGYVSVATGDLEGTTVEAPAIDDADGNHIINWNQEVRFIEVERDQKDIEVHVYEDGRLVSVGVCELEEKDEGVVIIQMHQAANVSEDAGEIVVSYKRLHTPLLDKDAIHKQHRAAEGNGFKDEEDEEQEETQRYKDGQTTDKKVHRLDMEDEEEEEKDLQEEQDKNADYAKRTASKAEPHEWNNQQEKQKLLLDSEEEAREEDYYHEAPQSHMDNHRDEGELYEVTEPHQQSKDDAAEDKSAASKKRKQSKDDAAEDKSAASKKRKQSKDDAAEDKSAASKKRKQSKDDAAEDKSAASKKRKQSKDEAAGDQSAAEAQPYQEEQQSKDEAAEDQSAAEAQPYQEDQQSKDEAAGDQSAAEAQPYQEDQQSKDEAAGDQSAAEAQPYQEEQQSKDEAAEDQSAAEAQPYQEEQQSKDEAAEDQSAAEAQPYQEEQQSKDEAAEDQSASISEPHKQEEQWGTAAAEQEFESQQQKAELEEGAAADKAEVYEHGEPHGEFDEEGRATYSIPAVSKQRRSPSWAPPSHKGAYQQPWYPSGSPEAEQHIPFSKTQLSKKNLESIRQLEKCKSRIEEESVRRSQTSRRSSARGSSPCSQ
ncbi:hypothetical protein JKF63_06792 [Porcisia hertigi]|uniref:C2 domain-containing protein n=1 Tax=Porcisia hertigi TaxID=2761500 RepID=A0A836LEP5_9TRYP|nr:hypothetical protein JKF63_06792 [Porcisia hertigi]